MTEEWDTTPTVALYCPGCGLHILLEEPFSPVCPVCETVMKTFASGGLSFLRTFEWERPGARRRLAWLLRCENLVRSMAEQICSPKTTAEQFVAEQLGEPVPGKRASR